MKKKGKHEITINSSILAVNVKSTGTLKETAGLAHQLHSDLIQRMSKATTYQQGREYG